MPTDIQPCSNAAAEQFGTRWPTVQLRHTLPDGTSHIDWMIASDILGRYELYTFRLPERVDALTPGARITAERIGEHRSAYLTHEGPVPGDRGHVERVTEGRIDQLQRWPHEWRLIVIWVRPGDEPLRQRVRLMRDRAGTWIVELDSASAPVAVSA